MRNRFVGALIAGLFWANTSQADAELLSRFVWERDESYFGGMSAMDLMPDGQEFVAIGDNAQVIVGRILRDGDKITGLDESRWIGGLRTPDGARVRGDWVDSEGIDLAEDGSFSVSFERHARVWRYANWEAAADPLPESPAFADLQENSSLEALAVGPDGTLYTIPERSGEWAKPFPVFVFRDGAWQEPLNLPRRGRYLVVGADFGPDGKLYVLERWFRGLLGFSSRVRRFDVTETELENEEEVLRTEAGVHDNLEGIAVWRDESGSIRLTMISDDNHNFFQTTEIVEYRLTE